VGQDIDIHRGRQANDSGLSLENKEWVSFL
jgi:hypothetical protein